MYKGVRFRRLPLSDVEEYLKEAVFYYRRAGWPTNRVYLVGADPFALSFGRLQPILELIKRYLPECETITMYAAVKMLRLLDHAIETIDEEKFAKEFQRERRSI